MDYDKSLLESWCKTPYWGDYLDQYGGVNKLSSKEGFDYLSRKYYQIVKERIRNCEELLKDHPADPFLYYAMAELYYRCNEDDSPAYLYKRNVRYYISKALKIDPEFAPAKELLDKANEWVEFLGGDKNFMPDFEVQFKDIDENKENENKC